MCVCNLNLEPKVFIFSEIKSIRWYVQCNNFKNKNVSNFFMMINEKSFSGKFSSKTHMNYFPINTPLSFRNFLVTGNKNRDLNNIGNHFSHETCLKLTNLKLGKPERAQWLHGVTNVPLSLYLSAPSSLGHGIKPHCHKWLL